MTWKDPNGLTDMPGIPEPTNLETVDTLRRLSIRKDQIRPAMQGLSNNYVLVGAGSPMPYPARDWLFGDPKQYGASLLKPKQFAMSWTNYKGVYEDGRQHLDAYASTLTSVDAANEAFWPTIAEHGTAYNLLILRRVTDARFAEYKELFGASDLAATFAPVQQQGRLYEIDLSMFASLKAWHYDDKPPRFNPATLTLLERDETKPGVFEPKWIRVWSQGQEPRVYSPLFIHQAHGSWLYALQAVKSSVTLYGIWLGHVYHWHMVTAAMQRTMYDTIRDGGHVIWRLLQPQFNYLIGFDYVLLDGASPAVKFSEIAPPSCIADPASFLQLTNMFAAGRQFFDDDPINELAKNGLEEADFTRDHPWDTYPVAQKLLQIWDISARFVSAFVSTSYADDHAVAADTVLQDWMNEAADSRYGNIRGLPVLDNRASLIRLLTSLIYRVTAHGISRLNDTANPALTFVANFPSCLQQEHIPSMTEDLSTEELLEFLPNTTTIGEMLGFYFAFVFSRPYKSLYPDGTDGDDFYFNGGVNDPRNVALTAFRQEMAAFMGEANVSQWPRNIET